MKEKNKQNCQYENCPLSISFNCENPLICPVCNSPMKLVNCFIPREQMHFNHHIEPCSEWICECGYSTYLGIISGKHYPFTKIIIEKK